MALDHLPKDEFRTSRPEHQRTSTYAIASCDEEKANSLLQETIAVPRLMPQETVATILGVSPKWLERDRWAEKRIPFVKVGRLVRYRVEDIAAYIEANIQGAA